MQRINLPLFDRLPAGNPVHSLAEQTMPLSGADLGTKVQAALQAIKRLVRQGKHLAVAWSGGKDSSVTLNLALTALRELAAGCGTLNSLRPIGREPPPRVAANSSPK